MIISTSYWFLLFTILLSSIAVIDSQTPVRNIVFLGATGNGKSTLCNLIYGEKSDYPFHVGHTSVGGTEKVVDHVCKAKNIKIIDTPGFGDNRFDEEHITSLIRDFTRVIIDPTIDSTYRIDAFVLVERLNPRATTLRSDLEHLRDLFGTAAFKSLIILMVPDDDKQYASEHFFEELERMDQVVSLLTEGKGVGELKKEWFVIWHNKNPRIEQEKELFEKIGKVEPYTHKKFVEAEKEVEERIHMRIKEAIERETRNIKRDYEENQYILKSKVDELTKRLENKEKELILERIQATEFAKEIQQILEEIIENVKSEEGIRLLKSISSFATVALGPQAAAISSIIHLLDQDL